MDLHKNTAKTHAEIRLNDFGAGVAFGGKGAQRIQTIKRT